jgi:anaerobic selenocysteine-containing dehydrogenase
MPTMSSHHFRACNLCEAMCGIVIEHEDGRILSIRGDDDDPFSRGHVCPKAVALKDVHEDPDRLRRPVRRVGRDFVEVSWEEAFDEVEERIRAVQKRYGSDAVATFFGNPTLHNYGAGLFSIPFVLSLKTRNRFSATSVDQLPRMVASLHLYGHQALFPIPDIDRTDYFLILGANPAASNGSIMTAPGVARRIEAIRARGGKVVLLDPRRTETAALADEHHFIRPGTDAFFLLALLETLFGEGLARPGRLAAFTKGLARVEEMARRYPAERVAARVGIAAADIRRIARELAAAPRAICYGRIGTSTQRFGTLASWLVDAVMIATGNLDRPGGTMFTTPAFDIIRITALGRQRGTFGAFRSRVRRLPEFSGELPVAALAEEIETPGPGQIRALITHAGNPVLSTPNGRRLDAALARLEYMVAVDIYVNETTRHAHVILPPTFALEHEHYDIGLHLVAVRNTAKWSPPLFAPGAGTRHDWEILAELMARLGGRTALERWTFRGVGRALSRLGPERILDLAMRMGPHRLPLSRVKRSVHGIDLGPLEPRLPALLQTEDHRIDLAPAALLADLPRLERFLDEPSPPATLELIGRRDLRSNNSWMHNSTRLVKGKDRCTLWMHPDDAARLGVATGEKVRVTSRAGSVDAPVEVTTGVMPGVVSLPHGWGHGRDGVRLSVARDHAGVSVNDLTDETVLDELSGNAGFSGVVVKATRTAV